MKYMERFLDDIFLIFLGTIDKLHKFFEEINQIHPNIKFQYIVIWYRLQYYLLFLVVYTYQSQLRHQQLIYLLVTTGSLLTLEVLSDWNSQRKQFFVTW